MTQPRLAILLPFVSREGGGVTEVARLQTHALVERGGFDIEIVCFRSDLDDTTLVDWPDVPIHRFNAFGPRNYCAAPGMARHMLRSNYDVVHVHGIWMFHVFAARLAMLRGSRVVISPHGMLESFILRNSRRLKAAVSGLYQKATLRRAKVIHALTSAEANEIAASCPGVRTEIIPNFVRAPHLDGIAPPWWQQDMKDKRVFLFLGRVHEKKGWRPLLEAWAARCATDPAFRKTAQLVFCGWVDGSEDFEPEVARLNATYGNVLFAGPQFGPDKDRSFAAADVFLLPSYSEGLPMAVLEAILAGTAVGMSRECNMTDLLDGAMALDTGHSAKTIIGALDGFMAMDDATLNEMLARAQRHVAAHYSEDVIMNSLRTLYQEIAPQ